MPIQLRLVLCVERLQKQELETDGSVALLKHSNFLAWMHVFTVPIQLFVCSPFLNALELYSGEVWPHNK